MKRKSSKALWAISLACSLVILVGSTGVTAKENCWGGPGVNLPLMRCVERRRQECKRDPMKNPEFCDSEAATQVFQTVCLMWGEPGKSPINMPPTIWPDL